MKRLGQPVGNWLTAEEGRQLLTTSEIETARGKRDRAMLAFLLGCGLRRSELVILKSDQIQRREDHWVIVDLVGKARHVRTVPIPPWVPVINIYPPLGRTSIVRWKRRRRHRCSRFTFPRNFSDSFPRHHKTNAPLAALQPKGQLATQRKQRFGTARCAARDSGLARSRSFAPLLLELTSCLVRFVGQIHEQVSELFRLTDEKPVIHEPLNGSDGAVELCGGWANNGNGSEVRV